ncbi:MAG: ATP-binding cassette domain-containing protein [Bacteroidales bacterium]|nr:ABC transporter ATP-binding protein [Bacteroidales bacterium]MDD5975451.1 ATP-binding cassette domain-containing protein [Bacteroidales bacterium]MDY5193102.1 ATP-binding cassette domain-containing protein [Candidatus Aphodosoma sp.]
MLLEIKNISKCYGNEMVLKPFNYSFDKGSIVGILGPNGAGKSTLMKIITGYIAPTSGEVLIDGHPMSPSAVDVKRNIGYLPELNPLYDDMYVPEYLAFVAKCYNLKEVSATVNSVIERVGLSAVRSKTIRQLSKGYRQRVGIAAAVIHSPKLLILDEPTSGLDPMQLIEIRQLIADLGKDSLVLFSSHIMQEVEQICNYIIILNHGNVVVSGEKDALVSQYGSVENLFCDTLK